jgi:hypothetical protein
LELSSITRRWDDGVSFKTTLGLYDTAAVNENFFIGRQWEGVDAEGLPTPVFNLLKRVVLFLIASLRSDSIAVHATPLDAIGAIPEQAARLMSDVIGDTIDAVFERTKFETTITQFLRNAAVRGDGALYLWWDAAAKTGQREPGDVAIENILNTRVHFGNPTSSDVSRQPWIIIESREQVEAVRRRAAQWGGDPDGITPDNETQDVPGQVERADTDRVTVLLHLRRDPESGRIFAAECTGTAWIRPEWDTALTCYPVVWMPWDEIGELQHGQAAVTGLIPNQIFVNKLFAMSMISLMSTAYPKVVYNGTLMRDGWDNRVGAAIKVTGAASDDMASVARVIEGRGLPPQVHEYIDAAINYTRDCMGAPDAALGNVRPDNASAIIAVQRAASVPLALTRQRLYQAVEDLARILIDFMGAYYGPRYVTTTVNSEQRVPFLFDYGQLEALGFSLQIDVGPAAYWSELARMTTLDNLFASGALELVDYLERLPDGYLPQRQELIDSIKARNPSAAAAAPPL